MRTQRLQQIRTGSLDDPPAMTPTRRHEPRLWSPFVMKLTGTSLVGCIAVVVSVCHVSCAQQATVEPSIHGANELERLIDGLANRNEPPTARQGPNAPCGREDFRIFRENYNWTEQRRVLGVLDMLIKKNSEVLWPYLVKHMDDKRYALTGDVDGVGVNLTVGKICRAMVEGDLTEPFKRELQSMVSIQRKDNGYVILFQQLSFSTPEKWSTSWKSKPLWNLQIELGEMVIRRLEGRDTEPELRGQRMSGTRKMGPGLVGGGVTMGGIKEAPTELKRNAVSQKEQATYANGIPLRPQSPSEMLAEHKRQAAQIEKIVDGIRRTKKPIVDNHLPPFFELYHFFTEQEANEIRHKYLKESSAEKQNTSSVDQKEPRQ